MLFRSALKEISTAFCDEKFQIIINSGEVSRETREEFVLSLVNLQDEKYINFIKLLNANDRLDQIPLIIKDLERKIALDKNIFVGTAQSGFDLSEVQLKELEDVFSKKFGATIELEAKKCSYSGIKVSLEDLGVEISFSEDRLKAQLTEHILKAI